MNLRVNDDGRLWPRVVAAAIPAAIPAAVSLAISLAIFVIMFWSDSRMVGAKTADALSRVEARIDKVETEAREARKAAADDRQRTAELVGDVRNVLQATERIEGRLYELMMDKSRRAPP